MRISLEQLLTKMGIEQSLEPYETIPFDYFNDDKGTDFTAGISMSGDTKFIDCEIQIIEEKAGEALPDLRQIFFMRAEKDKSGQYNAIYLKVMGKVLSGNNRNWFENGCRFFKLCTSHIKKGMVPDFEILYKSAFGTKSGDSGSAGGSSSRNLKNDKPPAKPAKPSGRL